MSALELASPTSCRPPTPVEVGGADAETCLEEAALRHSFRTGSTGSLRHIDSLPVLAAEDPEYLAWREEHPCVLQQFDAFVQLLRGKRLAVFLDYDGTLTPIVSQPDHAYMSTQMRAAVRAVAQQFPTAVISGRGREKVEGFVQLPELFYAGSHGMDIAGPRPAHGTDQEGLHLPQDTFKHQPAAEFQPLIDQVYKELCGKLADVPGALVEHNKFCVSAHFRNCAVESWQKVVHAVDEVVQSHSELHVTRGRKVLEVRPQLDWHKGRALLHLLQVLGLAAQPDVVALYVGDDKTDEDAFRTLAECNAGIGVLVSTRAKPTLATFTVRDPPEVQLFLLRLVGEYGLSAANGWHHHGSRCNGWAPAAAVPAPGNGS